MDTKQKWETRERWIFWGKWRWLRTGRKGDVEIYRTECFPNQNNSYVTYDSVKYMLE